ncbi:sugar ABC transporter substrate-binding protein [Labrys neptuniae]|uniref:ABC transporter substrate-binding protein n=1 Tax=Labrys neptuniae TaxID=376174 RepID=UPI00288EFD8A|nr:sugar ABC transporter substrate-binding protein [Labrys neptuniae]MDT3376919.1 sugar ABC transporter substrate-binding protein [Labrys neptuniae]
MKFLKIGLLLGALLSPLALSPAWADPVTLNFWVAWDPSQADGKAAIAKIAEFERNHPNIKIKIQTIAFQTLHDKLVTSIASGDAPDLSWGLIEWFGEFDRMKALADLTPYAAKWSDREAIYPNALKELTVDGRLLALPNYLGLRGLLYHADILRQAGVSAPPTTWDELVQASGKIKQATGKPGFGIAGKGVRSPQELIMYLAQNDVQIAKRQPDGKFRNDWGDDPAAMKRATEVFAFYRGLLDKGVIAPQASGWGWEEEDTNFSLGQYAMVINGSWIRNRAEQSPEQMKDVRVAAPPRRVKAATFFEISPFYIYKGKHLDETWEFAAFMLSKDYQAAVFPDRSPRMDVQGDAIWGTPFTSLTPIGVSFPPMALGSITRDMEESIGRVLLKNEEPAAVAAWLGKQINKSLRQTGQLSVQN